jgi:hypothetical protein
MLVQASSAVSDWTEASVKANLSQLLSLLVLLQHAPLESHSLCNDVLFLMCQAATIEILEDVVTPTGRDAGSMQARVKVMRLVSSVRT